MTSIEQKLLFDLENQKLQFSGAFRPMYMIRDDQLFDITGDKMPIGIRLKV